MWCLQWISSCRSLGRQPSPWGEERQRFYYAWNEARVRMVLSTSTKVCGTIQGTSKFCAKIVPVWIYHDNLKKRTVYVLIDDKISHSLVSPSLFDAFNQDYPQPSVYSHIVLWILHSIWKTRYRFRHWVSEWEVFLKSSFALNVQNCQTIEKRYHPLVSLNAILTLQISQTRYVTCWKMWKSKLLLEGTSSTQDQRKGLCGMPFAQKVPKLGDYWSCVYWIPSYSREYKRQQDSYFTKW